MNKERATAEAKVSSITELFDARNTFQSEIEARAKEALRGIGYNPWKWEDIEVSMLKRGKVDIVRVFAKIEEEHRQHEITHEFPTSQFNILTSRDHATV